MSKIPTRLVQHLLNTRLRTSEDDLIKSYALSIKEDVQKEKILWQFIHYSKSDDGELVQIGAANAITILSAAYVCFSGYDLSKIKIRNATFSNAILDSTNLTGADLIRDFSVTGLKISSDGTKLLSSYKYPPELMLHDVDTLKQVRNFKGHDDTILDIIYKDLIISASHDYTVKIWDERDVHSVGTIQKFDYPVSSVDLSYDAQLLAIGSNLSIYVYDVRNKSRPMLTWSVPRIFSSNMYNFKVENLAF